MTRRLVRKQCKKCPWRKDVNPYDIPNGYQRDKHAALERTVAQSGCVISIIDPSQPIHAMACHETPVGRELACVGWLVNQLGDGNNIALRFAMLGRVPRMITIGEQHERFEDTLPKEETD